MPEPNFNNFKVSKDNGLITIQSRTDAIGFRSFSKLVEMGICIVSCVEIETIPFRLIRCALGHRV